MMQEKGRSFSHNEPPFGAGAGRPALTHWSDMKKGNRTPNSLLPCQMLALGPTLRQDGLYHSHAAAARIMRNDTIALWKDEGRRLPGFRYKLAELRPVVNREKFQRHPLDEGTLPECRQGRRHRRRGRHHPLLHGAEPPSQVPRQIGAQEVPRRHVNNQELWDRKAQNNQELWDK